MFSGILDLGWPFPLHSTKSERCVVAFRRGHGCGIPLANVVDFGIIARPDFRGDGVEKVGMGGNSGPRFVCGRSIDNFGDRVVSLGITHVLHPVEVGVGGSLLMDGSRSFRIARGSL